MAAKKKSSSSRSSTRKGSSRLKVFMTQIGFHNWLVAAPSQKAALEAWDVRENLFAMGSAQIVTDQDCIDLALKTPGVPVPVDARNALAKISKVVRLDDHPARKGKTSAHAAPVKPTAKKAPPRKVDRSKLDKAEDALDAFRKRAVRERGAILRAQKALDLKAESLNSDLDAEEERLEAAIELARRRYEKDLNA